MRDRNIVALASPVSVLLAAAQPPAASAAPPRFEHVHALAFDAAGRGLWFGALTVEGREAAQARRPR
jgi:hypothetical protein